MVKIISHRGYLEGKDELRENEPTAIIDCINKGFDVEIDLNLINCYFPNERFASDFELALGHDKLKCLIKEEFLTQFGNCLFVHAKSIESFSWLILSQANGNLKYFYHTEEDLVKVLDAHNFNKYLWSHKPQIYNNYPDKEGMIIVTRDCFDSKDKMTYDEIKDFGGICTDFPLYYKKLIEDNEK